MLIPLRDDHVTRRVPAATTAIVAVNVLVFVYMLGLSQRGQEAFALGYGMTPSVLFGTNQLSPSLLTIDPWMTIFTSMFIHGGFLHIFGNMVYLWVFGKALEDTLGSVRFVLFYLVCGVAAALTQAFVEADATVPMVGASGAISGVLGAYLVLFPRARVLVLFFYFLITTLNLPAKALLLWWIAIQLLSILLAGNQEGGVAWYAHVGGFIAGMALVWLFRPTHRPPQYVAAWTQRPSPWRRRGPWG
jgi:membrane associated rhomboid family serine protease